MESRHSTWLPAMAGFLWMHSVQNMFHPSLKKKKKNPPPKNDNSNIKAKHLLWYAVKTTQIKRNSEVDIYQTKLRIWMA